MIRIAILSSRSGMHLHALQAAMLSKEIEAEVVMVLSDKEDAAVLDVASGFSFPHQYLPVNGRSREEYDAELLQCLEQVKPDLILLLGYMRILSHSFVTKWEDKIFNIHPSLLPRHKGLMDLDVHRAVLEAKESETGCSVHLVIAEVDAGPVVVQKKCKVYAEDTANTIKQRVQALESIALIEAIKQV